MRNRFCKKPLYEVTRTLANVAMGVEKAQLVIRNAKLVNVCTAEIQEGVDVAISEGRIALVGDAAHCIGEKTDVIDASGQYIAPGFIDAHTHVECSMISVGEFARAVIPHGTTCIFMDPHEICNVCGIEGVKAIIEDAMRSPLKAISNVPSCVPAVAGFEDTGSEIGPEEVQEMMTWDGIMGLGEMVSFQSIIDGDARMHDELARTLQADQVITGHYPVPDTGAGLNAYIASGVRCCHESTRVEDVLEKMRHGMHSRTAPDQPRPRGLPYLPVRRSLSFMRDKNYSIAKCMTFGLQMKQRKQSIKEGSRRNRPEGSVLPDETV